MAFVWSQVGHSLGTVCMWPCLYACVFAWVHTMFVTVATKSKIPDKHTQFCEWTYVARYTMQNIPQCEWTASQPAGIERVLNKHMHTHRHTHTREERAPRNTDKVASGDKWMIPWGFRTPDIRVPVECARTQLCASAGGIFAYFCAGAGAGEWRTRWHTPFPSGLQLILHRHGEWNGMRLLYGISFVRTIGGLISGFAYTIIQFVRFVRFVRFGCRCYDCGNVRRNDYWIP